MRVVLLVCFTAGLALPCNYGVSAGNRFFYAEGGTTTINVETAADCYWDVKTPDFWTTLEGQTTQQGSGSVTLRVAANGGPARTANLTVGEQKVEIHQAASGCVYEVSEPKDWAPAGGGIVQASVTTAADCEWVITSNPLWAAVVSNLKNSGSGAAKLSVTMNPGTASRGG